MVLTIITLCTYLSYPQVINDKAIKDRLDLFCDILIYAICITQRKKLIDSIEYLTNLFLRIFNKVFSKLYEEGSDSATFILLSVSHLSNREEAEPGTH